MPWTTPPGSGATVYIWNGYSLAERDRRWSAVRDNAAKAGFDCILVPLGDGIDARYMTQLRCSAMVLPTDGRAPIVVADRRSNNEWVPDPWQTGREWAEPMGEALRDLGFERARIGVAGLKGGRFTHCNSIDGVVNHSALETAMSKVPNARFEDATDVIGAVRYVKSTEEIQFVRRSAEVAAAGLDALIKLARPGVDAGIFYADVLAEMLALRSEYFPMTLTIDAIDTVKPKRYLNPPIGRRLEAGALITSEINAIMGAQLTQVCQPVLLGKIPERVEAGDRIAAGSLRSRIAIDQTRRDLRRAGRFRQRLRRQERHADDSANARLRLRRRRTAVYASSEERASPRSRHREEQRVCLETDGAIRRRPDSVHLRRAGDRY